MKFRTKLLLVAVLLAATFVVKETHPEVGEEIGRWISGARDSRIGVAVSGFVSSLTEGDRLSEAVTVFYDALGQS